MKVAAVPVSINAFLNNVSPHQYQHASAHLTKLLKEQMTVAVLLLNVLT